MVARTGWLALVTAVLVAACVQAAPGGAGPSGSASLVASGTPSRSASRGGSATPSSSVTTDASPSPATSPAATPDQGRLVLATEPPSPSLPPGAVAACERALLAPVRVAREDNEVVLVNVDTGARADVVWPRGFSVRLGRGVEIVAPDGRVVAVEGDVIDDAGGGQGPDGRFHICSLGAATYLRGASPSPDPATLVIRTQEPIILPPGAAEGCPQALLPDVRIAREGRMLRFEGGTDVRPVEIVWPWGFSARVVGGRAELVDSYGDVVAREGDRLDLGGGGGPPDDAFHVCAIGDRMYSSVRSG